MTWINTTDGSGKVNNAAVAALVAQSLGTNAGTTTPDSVTPTWGVFAVLPDGLRLQVGSTSYATQALAIAAIPALTA